MSVSGFSAISWVATTATIPVNSSPAACISVRVSAYGVSSPGSSTDSSYFWKILFWWRALPWTYPQLIELLLWQGVVPDPCYQHSHNSVLNSPWLTRGDKMHAIDVAAPLQYSARFTLWNARNALSWHPLMIHRTQPDGLPIAYQFHAESESQCED